VEYEGIGLLKLQSDTFWQLTPREFIIKIQAYYQEKEDWERVIRLHTYYTVSPHIKDKIEPTDLWTLPSERVQKQERQAKDEEKAAKAFLKAIS
jgi:hypothetical protein